MLQTITLAITISFLANSDAFGGHRSHTIPSKTYRNSLLCMNSERLKLIAGNWKMNTDLRSALVLTDELIHLTSSVDPASVEVAVIPPYPFLRDVSKVIQDSRGKLSISVGAQLSSGESKGAFTGAVSASMLKSVGAKYILAGHSERRTIFGEDDNLVNLSLLSILKEKLKPILCVGETKEEYELGLGEEVCTVQLSRGLKGVAVKDLTKVVIAYEPIWF